MGNDYKQSMNLPKTDFSMRANLPQNEPKRLEKWAEEDIYHRILEKNKDGEPFILHDGPPYANGPIHIGHAFNKILKDFVIKSHAQRRLFHARIFLVGTATASRSSMRSKRSSAPRKCASCLRRRCAVCAASGQKSSSTCSATTSSAWA